MVCSARSGHTKATGTTNLLLRAALEALRPKGPEIGSSLPSLRGSPSQSPAPGGQSGTSTPATPATPRGSYLLGGSLSSLARLAGGRAQSEDGKELFDDTVDEIKQGHLDAARQVIRNSPDVLAAVEEELEYDCERLRGFLRAAQVRSLSREMHQGGPRGAKQRTLLILLTSVLRLAVPTSPVHQIIDEISTRSKDIIMGVGERLSCRIITAALRDRVSLAHCAHVRASHQALGLSRIGAPNSV